MPLKLLIVDDAALMRKHLGRVFQAAGDFEISFARNGKEALAQIEQLQPDVVTLDINMPEMDGLTCLSHIMTESPRPVVMVSSLTAPGAEATFEALELGAVDFIPKPDGTVSLHIDKIEAELVAKVRSAVKARFRSRNLTERIRRQREALVKAAPPAVPVNVPPADGLVLIGVSTGGPGALDLVLPALPADFPWPVLVCQHMPASFTGVLARRMDEACRIRVRELVSPTALHGGCVWLGRGDADLLVVRRSGTLTGIPAPSSPNHVWHPSVDRMVRSALEQTPPRAIVGVLLTGMGDDGAQAMAELHSMGGRTIAEAEETAVVWGMPRELVNRRGADVVLPIDQVAAQLRRWVH